MTQVWAALGRWPLPASLAVVGLVTAPLICVVGGVAKVVLQRSAQQRVGKWLLVVAAAAAQVGALYGCIYGAWWWLLLRLTVSRGWLLALGLAPGVGLVVGTVRGWPEKSANARAWGLIAVAAFVPQLAAGALWALARRG